MRRRLIALGLLTVCLGGSLVFPTGCTSSHTPEPEPVVCDETSVLEGDFLIELSHDAAKLQGVTKLTGTLTVVTALPTDAYDPLSCLRSVDGLEFADGAADDMSGFGNLETAREVFILNAWDLETLTPLDLQGVEELGIFDSGELQTLGGVDLGGSLQSVRLDGNAKLQNVDLQFDQTQIQSITIEDNATLTSLSGFNGLVTAEDLNLIYNPSLASLSDLDALSTVSDQLRIEENACITDDEAWEFADRLVPPPAEISIYGNGGGC